MVSDRGRTERCYIQIRVDDGMRREREREREGGGRKGSRVGSLSSQMCVCVCGALAHTEDCGGSYSKQREAPKPSSRHAILSFHNDRVPSRLQPEFQYTRIFNEPSPVLRQPSIPYPRGLPLPPVSLSLSFSFLFYFFLVFFFHSRAVTARSFSGRRASFEARPKERTRRTRSIRSDTRPDRLFRISPWRGWRGQGRARRDEGNLSPVKRALAHGHHFQPFAG